MHKYFTFLIPCLFFYSVIVNGQIKDTPETKYTPYELMSSYYNKDFNPFKKGNKYFGVSVSLEDRKMENTDNLFQKVLDGSRTNYNIQLKSGYYINDYAMLGLNFSVLENKFEGSVIRDSDTIQSHTIKRGFSITPNYRTSFPLTRNERLSFFTTATLSYGRNTTLKRDVKYIDEIEKSFTKNHNFKVGISPGLTFFAMENFALEVQLDVLGYELSMNNKTKNDTDKSKDTRHNIDFNIDILSMKLGMAYFIKPKRNRK